MPKRKTPTTPATALDDASPVAGLTYREELFAHHYVETANASEAYRRSGGQSKNPDAISSQMMAKPHVAKRIAELRTKRLAAIQFNAEEVLQRLIAQVRADLSDIFDERGALKPVHEWPDVWRTGLIGGIEVQETFSENEDGDRVFSGYLKKVKVADRVKVLELAGRHVNIGAWKEKVQLDTSDVLRAMLEAFARDTWVNAPTGPADTPASPAAPRPAPAAPGIASVLDGR